MDLLTAYQTKQERILEPTSMNRWSGIGSFSVNNIGPGIIASATCLRFICLREKPWFRGRDLVSVVIGAYLIPIVLFDQNQLWKSFCHRFW
jgi:hypothetical protein